MKDKIIYRMRRMYPKGTINLCSNVHCDDGFLTEHWWELYYDDEVEMFDTWIELEDFVCQLEIKHNVQKLENVTTFFEKNIMNSKNRLPQN